MAGLEHRSPWLPMPPNAAQAQPESELAPPSDLMHGPPLLYVVVRCAGCRHATTHSMGSIAAQFTVWSQFAGPCQSAHPRRAGPASDGTWPSASWSSVCVTRVASWGAQVGGA